MDDLSMLYERLEMLIERERASLLTGDLDTLGALLSEKELLIADVLQGSNGPELPGLLRDKMHRNQLLLKSAMEGINAVSARLAALQEVRATLGTYDAHGRKAGAAPQPFARIERRA
ncbi:flagellar biosynthesis protein FlgN [Sulfitobacter albidus]|uniref:Flagellar biosynthesis protein FlgN n=1 Tax=Sulfitobacter albidus TaxID=2829501 RepID=A0A975JD51_9RHOB|nr:flagellar biosynthesis protein FlgN [Sulfitobacter albidus]QUJ76284.1 flagellar biosynthesis protein FlgN [Sulfitobacter albidus]